MREATKEAIINAARQQLIDLVAIRTELNARDQAVKAARTALQTAIENHQAQLVVETNELATMAELLEVSGVDPATFEAPVDLLRLVNFEPTQIQRYQTVNVARDVIEEMRVRAEEAQTPVEEVVVEPTPEDVPVEPEPEVVP